MLCPRRALQFYLERTQEIRKQPSIQLFVAYGKSVRGQPISKQRLSKWLQETICFAYVSEGRPAPSGVKGHQTRKQAVSMAELAGVSPDQICEAATWTSTCTFAKFYCLNLAAQANATFGRRVLQVAGASSSVSTRGSRKKSRILRSTKTSSVG